MTATRNLSVALLAASTLALSACGGGASAAPGTTPTSAAPTTTQEVALDPAQCSDDAFYTANEEFCASATKPTFSGPASEVAVLPNNLEVRLVSASARPNDQDVHPDPGHDVQVTTVVEIKNTGTDPFVFPAAKLLVGQVLYYGVDQYDAQGWMTDGDSADLPRQLVPGSTATVTVDYTLPSAGLVELALEFTPDSDRVPSYTFTGVQDVLQGFFD